MNNNPFPLKAQPLPTMKELYEPFAEIDPRDKEAWAEQQELVDAYMLGHDMGLERLSKLFDNNKSDHEKMIVIIDFDAREQIEQINTVVEGISQERILSRQARLNLAVAARTIVLSDFPSEKKKDSLLQFINQQRKLSSEFSDSTEPVKQSFVI